MSTPVYRPGMGLAENLRALRAARGYTLDDLSSRAEVGRSVINAIETRGSRASRHAPKLASALGVPVSVLLSDAPIDTDADYSQQMPKLSQGEMMKQWPFRTIELDEVAALDARELAMLENAMVEGMSKIAMMRTMQAHKGKLERA